MSTILQALKRLEKSRAAHAAGTPNAASLKTFNKSHVLHRVARFAWLRNRISTWSLLILALMVSGLALYAFSRTSPVDQKPHLASLPAPDDVVMSPVNSFPAFEEDSDAIVNNAPEPPIRQSLPLAPLKAEEITETAVNAGAKPASSVATTPAAPSAPTDHQSAADAERLKDGSLSIQAIAWSANPEERIAVINNRVTREGATIEGYAIVTITAEAVYARKAGKLWVVRFGRP